MLPISPAHRFAASATLLVLAASVAACGGGAAGSGLPAQPAPAEALRAGDVLTRAQIDQIRANNMEELLQGRFRGVQLLHRDGELALRIRGDGDPLLVLNGSPAASIGALWSLNPGDIEQIEIIKGPATSIYGTDGGNGVVRVTMRSR